ncbi:LPS export ABC transporter permease LptF [Piscinibacter sp. XHJ-5]|uniref:LPS export ABC transporter permease LptF n=1 Tax=Piscinibacter sp. XHJ-5 TaxID=3037797 RepID=UPI0024531A9C|nr:LPS export ABC transporter permease LptF [Piscinibacter sp. XHJ-5]
MLFDSTLRRDLARSFGATLVVILTIVLTMMLIRTLGQAAGGNIAPQDVVLLLGYVALGQLPTMLALSMFIAVVATLSRMYRESEMAIWFASGVGLTRFVRPVLRTSLPVLVVVGLLALFVWPWVNQRSVELRDRFERRSDLSRVAPGQFQSSSDGSRVFFIERDSQDGRTGRNVFILSSSGAVEAVTTAKSGRIAIEGEDRFLLLDRGQRNEQNAKTHEKTLSRFEKYRVLAGERMLSRADNLPPKARTTGELLRSPSPAFQGELVWRLGLVLGGANLTLLGIALSEANPRRASNWNLLFALLAFVVYYNVINLTQAWVAGGKVGMGAALIGAHGGAFALAVGMLWWRDARNSRRKWSTSAAASAKAGA